MRPSPVTSTSIRSAPPGTTGPSSSWSSPSRGRAVSRRSPPGRRGLEGQFGVPESRTRVQAITSDRRDGAERLVVVYRRPPGPFTSFVRREGSTPAEDVPELVSELSDSLRRRSAGEEDGGPVDLLICTHGAAGPVLRVPRDEALDGHGHRSWAQRATLAHQPHRRPPLRPDRPRPPPRVSTGPTWTSGRCGRSSTSRATRPSWPGSIGARRPAGPAPNRRPSARRSCATAGSGWDGSGPPKIWAGATSTSISSVPAETREPTRSTRRSPGRCPSRTAVSPSRPGRARNPNSG